MDSAKRRLLRVRVTPTDLNPWAFAERKLLLVFVFAPLLTFSLANAASDANLRQSEQRRIEVIEQVSNSVVSILTPDQSGGGSGVIITPDGYGITNFHVVMAMLKTREGLAGLSDGKTYPLEVLGIDPTGDLAMFRLAGRDRFDFAPLGDSDELRTGDEVLALGNPFMLAEDYSPTATFGIISALNRYQYGADARSLVYTDCIQIDASINPGNSGGPLFDLQGRLIGINGRASFKKDDRLHQRVNVGVAYAITINQIKRFLPGLKEGWLVEHGTLGATVTDSPDGVLFNNILDSSAADRIGIERGDRLVALDGREIGSANAFLNVIGVYPAGWPVTITWRRGDQEFHREISLDPLAISGDLPWKKAEPNWVRAVAKGTTPTTLPFDVTSLARAPDRSPSPADPLMASLLSGVVKIYGGRIAGRPGYASGVLVEGGGRVVTPLSVLLDASDLRVVTADGRMHSARVIHRDEYRQLVLLEIRDLRRSGAESRPTGLSQRFVGIDESVHPSPGDRVYLVGNPFKIAEGDEPCSVSRGIVSGWTPLDATLPGGARPVAYRGEVLVMDAIASNPGSPGSAVFDRKGRWVGLVGEVVESRLTNTPINYAYPVAEVAAFLREARTAPTAPAEVTARTAGPGYHGIRLSRIGYRQKLPFVESVAASSPAAHAGVAAGDLILTANSKAVARSQAFEEICDALHAGDDLTLVLKRGDQIVTARIKLAEVAK